MRRWGSLRHAGVMVGVAVSLGFGAAQALASPGAAGPRPDACAPKSNPDEYCYTWCRLNGFRSGFCAGEDGCACQLARG
jgi:hypothetical protein